MQPYMTLSADVLIVGGGSAGVMAAIRAKQMDPGQRVVVFEKGDVQYSGCIARGMDAMNIVAVPGPKRPPSCMWRPTGKPARASWTSPSTMPWPNGPGPS